MSDAAQYEGRVRVRTNGLLQHENALLMVKMRSPVTGEDVWIPPGGGIGFGESLMAGLIREMREETGLQVKPGPLRYIHEIIQDRIHAVEFYFDVFASHPETARLGSDPEFSNDRQLLKDIKFISLGEIDQYPVVPDYLRRHFPSEARNSYPKPIMIHQG